MFYINSLEYEKTFSNIRIFRERYEVRKTYL